MMLEHFDRARTYRSLIHSDLRHLTLVPCLLANMPIWIRCRNAHHSVENLPPCPLKIPLPPDSFQLPCLAGNPGHVI
jgi:hypothetical protein